MDASDTSFLKVFETSWNGSIQITIRLLIRIFTLTDTNHMSLNVRTLRI